MNALAVLSCAVSGLTDGVLPERRVVALPPPGEHRRRARLPGLAMNLARAVLAAARSEGGGDDDAVTAPADTSVILGTGLGSLTETAAFVENMIRQNEEMPRPRAFSASVHNATASQVARRLGARGECQTYSHGELSFAQALFAGTRVRGSSRVLVGAVDETSPYVERATRRCASPGMGEGGALFWCAPSGRREDGAPVLAEVRVLGQARPRDARSWIEQQVAAVEADGILWPYESPLRQALGGERTTEWTGHHHSSPATATALAVTALAGESDLPWSAWRSIAVVTAIDSGEVAILHVERPA